MNTIPVPVAILTGFLGAGKTTLLNVLLKDPFLSNAAVIINEFGDVGIDHLLVERSDENVIEMASGCLCCTIRGDLIDTMHDLLARRGRGDIKAFDRIVIETTGLADPAPVLHAVMSDPDLLSACRLEGVITVVDAFNGMATLDAHPEAVKQVAVADRIVLTKVDLLVGREGEDTLFAIIARLRTLNPAARLLTTHQNEATAERLFTWGCSIRGRRPPMSRPGSRPRPMKPVKKGGGGISLTATITMCRDTTITSGRSASRSQVRSVRRASNFSWSCLSPTTAPICCG